MTPTFKSTNLQRKLAAAALGAGLIWAAGSAVADPAGDPANGAKLFMQCRACHTVDQGGANTVGPNLSGVYGAKAATHPGFTYSSALSGSGLTWTDSNLDKWLTRPTSLVPGNKMAFFGVSSPKSRQDIIAYLATLKHK